MYFQNHDLLIDGNIQAVIPTIKTHLTQKLEKVGEALHGDNGLHGEILIHDGTGMDSND